MDRRKSKMKSTLSGLVNAQHRRKRVEASEHVLETYHESFLYGKVSPSVRVRGTIRGGWLGLLWHFVEFVLAVTSGAIYVYSTYNDFNKFNWASRVQNYISLAFAIDYVLRVYSESARWNYIFSFWGLIDLFSAIPIIFFAKSANKNGQFLKLLQFLRIVRVISLMNKLGIVGSTVIQQILLLITSTFTAVFLIAGILQYVEYYGAPESRKAECPEEGCINFWNAIYFIIVTISTVGYGDITPKTTLGQVVAICAIMGALSFIPIQIGKITSLASRRPYGGNFNERKITDSRYIIIGGSISFQAVQECLAEFFNPTHCQDLEVYPLRVTILAPFSPSFEMKQLLSLYNGLVEFIEGSPIRQSDLSRVSAKRASVFFLLADKDVEDRGLEDAAQIVKALAVHRYCNNDNTSNIRIIVEVLEPETEASAVWDLTDNRGIEVICPTKFHFKMIARSCLVKGLYTFITNLFTSEIKMKKLPANSFVSEYFHSFDNEVYPLIFPKACCGMLFEEVVEFVFEEFNVVLFALDVDVMDQENQHRERKVFLHPKGHVIDADDVGLVICWDLASAYAISKYGNQEMDNKKKWKRKKLVSSKELQKYRTGPIVDAAEDSNTAAHMSYTVAGNAKTLESRMRSEISNRGFPERPSRGGGSQHGSSQHGNKQHDGTDERSSRGGGSQHGSSQHGNKQHDGTDERSSRGGGSQHGSSQHGNKQRDGTDDTLESGYGQDGAYRSDDDDVNGEYPRGMSLEHATEMLLAWPPIGPAHVQPHAAVLERRQDVILENLRERTVPVVSLTVPHILVCCQSHWPDNIFYFIKELRKPDLPNPPIVILHPSEPTAAQWGKVGVFDAVHFLKGSPIYELDLMRGGVLQAEKVVILGFHDTAVELSGEGAEGMSRAKRNIPSAQRSDVDNIVISANVERLVGTEAGVMIIDMQHTFALYYLRPKFEIQKKHVMKADYKRNPEALVHFGPPYMEGKAVSPLLLGFLLRSSFYNKNTVSIVDQLIEGGHTIRDGKLSYQSPRLLQQMAAPKEYWNRQYGDMFVGLLRDKGVLAVGLYRAQGTLGAPTAYVFTNPMKNTVVHDVDLVYVIS